VLLIEGNELLVFFGGPGFDFAFFTELILLFNLKTDFYSVFALNGFGKLSATFVFHGLFIEENKL